jgi:hypothetical protein
MTNINKDIEDHIRAMEILLHSDITQLSVKTEHVKDADVKILKYLDKIRGILD